MDYLKKLNDILNLSRQTFGPGTKRYKHAWSGSAFRSHPCGIKKGNILMVNRWNIHYNGGDIYITDGEGWSDDYCTQSCAHGNPYPQPIGGVKIQVFSNGKWASEEYRERLEPTVLKILSDACDHIEQQKTIQETRQEKERIEQKERTEIAIESALSKAAISD